MHLENEATALNCKLGVHSSVPSRFHTADLNHEVLLLRRYEIC